MKEKPERLAPVVEIIQEVVRKIQNDEMTLPVLPNVVHEIESLANDPETKIETLVKVLERDAVVSLALVKLANSPLYRGTEKINRVSQAVSRLGMKEVRNMVAAIAIRSLYGTNSQTFKKLMVNQWRHSLACAYGCVVIARELSLEDPDRYFLMGLVHDVGKVVLFRVLSEMSLQEASLDMAALMKNIEVVHSNLGGVLLQTWKFDRETIRCVVLHHKTGLSASEKKSVFIVNLANHLVNNLGFSLFKRDPVNLLTLASARHLKIQGEQVAVASATVQQIMEKIGENL